MFSRYGRNPNHWQDRPLDPISSHTFWYWSSDKFRWEYLKFFFDRKCHFLKFLSELFDKNSKSSRNHSCQTSMTLYRKIIFISISYVSSDTFEFMISYYTGSSRGRKIYGIGTEIFKRKKRNASTFLMVLF